MTQDAVLRVAIGLGLVIAAILAAAWLARRSGLIQRQGGNVLRLVGSLSLGPRQSIAVVQVQDTWLVLGLTPNNVTTLHTLPADTTDSSTGAPEAGPQSTTFSAALAARLGKALKRP